MAEVSYYSNYECSHSNQTNQGKNSSKSFLPLYSPDTSQQESPYPKETNAQTVSLACVHVVYSAWGLDHSC